MFTSKLPYTAIALLILGYLVAVVILMQGDPSLSLGYLTGMALLGVATAWLFRRHLRNKVDSSRVTASHAQDLVPMWLWIGIFFGVLFIINGGMLVFGLFQPMEAYFIPLPEIVILLVLVLRMFFMGQDYNKEVQRKR